MTGSNAMSSDCCIVGGGPAGVMLGYLLARAGRDVVVLEKHKDFLRDFRGDTIHPSTLQLMHELGLLEEFLRLPHDELATVKVLVDGQEYRIGDFKHLPTRCKFIALMPQWNFLTFLTGRGQRFPSFHLEMEAEAVELVEDGGGVRGVEVRSASKGRLRVEAPLVVGCDGRHSTVREKAGLKVHDFQVPIDVLWMKIPKDPSLSGKALGYFDAGRFMVLIDRGSYFQCGYIIPKGGAEQVRAAGMEALRRSIVHMAPFVRREAEALQSWEQLSLLTVTVDRLERWYKPGLLCIGDAAHAMSPAGGVGVNLAIQDAVAAANRLAVPLASGRVTVRDLEAVQKRRMLPVRVIQSAQVLIHRRVINGDVSAPVRLPGGVAWALRALPALQLLPAFLVGIGPRPEHVRTAPALARP